MPAAQQAVEVEPQAVRRGMWGRLMDYRRDHPRGWAFMAAALMGGLSLVIGLGTTIYDGALNKSTRPMLFFLAVGLGAFYLPGLLMGYAAFCLRRGRAVPVLLGSVAAAAQGVMAGVVTPGQFYFTSFELVPLVEGILWTAADFYVAWLLWRSLPWVRADAAAHHGFAVESAEVVEADTA